jgi:cell division protease FtsH
VLDPALLRPGRFDRQVVVPTPDVRGREAILKVHTRLPLARMWTWMVLARGTRAFPEPTWRTWSTRPPCWPPRATRTRSSMEDFERAKDKVLMGTERRSLILSDEEKKVTAYHEAGHALVAMLTPGTDPLHKVTIIPRGRALGLTQQLPVDERHTYPREYLINNLACSWADGPPRNWCSRR